MSEWSDSPYHPPCSGPASAWEKIILFTSHRYDTIRKADTIVVLLDGRIAKSGTHEQLASHTREFWSLFLAQGSHLWA